MDIYMNENIASYESINLRIRRYSYSLEHDWNKLVQGERTDGKFSSVENWLMTVFEFHACRLDRTRELVIIPIGNG